jgi:hypothetical protein
MQACFLTLFLCAGEAIDSSDAGRGGASVWADGSRGRTGRRALTTGMRAGISAAIGGSQALATYPFTSSEAEVTPQRVRYIRTIVSESG